MNVEATANSAQRSTLGRLGARAIQSIVTEPAAMLLVLTGAISLIVMLVQAPDVVHQLYRDADTVSGFVLPQLSGHGPPGTVIDLGNHPWYEAWWFERSTVGLPGHFVIWEVAPFVVYFAGLAVAYLAAAVALGRRAALLTAVTLLVVGSGLRQIVFEPGARVGLIVHTGLLCAGLLAVWKRSQAGRVSLRWLIGWGVALAVLTAPGATDALLMIDGLVPFVAAAWLWWWRNRTRAARTVALFATGVALATFAGESLLTSVMIHDGISASLGLSSFQFLPAATWPTDLANTTIAWVALADGNFFGLPVNKADVLTFVLGVLALGGLTVATKLSIRSFRTWWTERATATATSEQGSRDLFIGFWALVLIMTFASFSLTSIAANADSRYLISGWVAAASLLGSVATRHGRTVLVACVVVFAAIIVRDNVAFGVPTPAAAYPQRVVRQIERFVTRHGATTGFADYYYSHSLTWETGFRLKVYPVWPCDGERPDQICQRALASDSAWFIPRRGIRTFLISGPQPMAIAVAPTAFGVPIAKATFGDFTVAVYGHDVAAEILQF